MYHRKKKKSVSRKILGQKEFKFFSSNYTKYDTLVTLYIYQNETYVKALLKIRLSATASTQLINLNIDSIYRFVRHTTKIHWKPKTKRKKKHIQGNVVFEIDNTSLSNNFSVRWLLHPPPTRFFFIRKNSHSVLAWSTSRIKWSICKSVNFYLASSPWHQSFLDFRYCFESILSNQSIHIFLPIKKKIAKSPNRAQWKSPKDPIANCFPRR